MLKRINQGHNPKRYRDNKVHRPEETRFFYFTLSEKGHDIILPSEDKTSWEQLHNITWDPARGD